VKQANDAVPNLSCVFMTLCFTGRFSSHLFISQELKFTRNIF
jgi:hypothetical protein